MKLLEPKTQFRPCTTLPGAPARNAPAIIMPASPAEAVRRTLAAVSETELRPVASAAAGLAFQPRTLLAVTLYCYLHEIYGSEDTEDALRRDALFRGLCGQEFPDARVLRRFRRLNRDLLQHTLTAALKLLLPPELSEAALQEAAMRRIGTAMFIDSMECSD